MISERGEHEERGERFRRRCQKCGAVLAACTCLGFAPSAPGSGPTSSSAITIVTPMQNAGGPVVFPFEPLIPPSDHPDDSLYSPPAQYVGNGVMAMGTAPTTYKMTFETQASTAGSISPLWIYRGSAYR